MVVPLPSWPRDVFSPGQHFLAPGPDRVGRFHARPDAFDAGQRHARRGHHRARDGAARDRRDGVRFTEAFFAFAALLDAEVPAAVVAPGHHFAVVEQGVVARAPGRDLLDAAEARHLRGPVTGDEVLGFGVPGHPFEALFVVAPLSEFGGPPGPHGAVVEQGHGVGVADRDFLDVAEAHYRHGVVAVLLGPVPELGLVVDPPRLERAVAHHGEAELEAAPDLAGRPAPPGRSWGCSRRRW